MKIYELFEQTIAPVPPGQGSKLPTTQPTEPPPQTSNTPQTPAPTGIAPSTQAGQTTTPPPPPPPNQQIGQNPQQAAQQMKQVADQSKQTMTDLDKIAAQIVGLKQKQQQMQQQLQTTV